MTQTALESTRVRRQIREWYKCRDDFLYWLTTYVWVMDKEVGRRVPFRPYPGQVEIVEHLIGDRSVWLLKSRRLGATAIVLAYILHESQFFPDKQTIMVSQNQKTVAKLVRWYNDIDKSQPEWMIQKREVNNTEQITYENGSEIIIMIGSSETARSFDCDHLLVDEAAFVDYLAELKQAAEPTLETSGGVAIVMSTSDGPGCVFEAEFWRANGPYSETGTVQQGGKYHQMFLSWRERPGRDQAWRDQKDIELGVAAAKREYPGTPQEAFQAGGGRMFPSFSRGDHIIHCERPKGVKLYRAMDFGSSPTSAYVCLWLWHDADAEVPRLTFEPDCEVIEESPETVGEFAAGIKQMIAYSRNDKTGKRIKLNDDLPDALRYGVTTFQFFGHVHVYRVLFLRSGSDAGSVQYSPQEWFRQVMRLSGWQQMEHADNLWQSTPDTENYAGTVGDRSGKGYMNLLREQQHKGGFGMAITPHVPIPDVAHEDEVEQGVQWVNSLLNGKVPMQATKYRTPKEAMREDFLDGTYVPTTMSERNRVRRFEDFRKRFDTKKGKKRSLLR